MSAGRGRESGIYSRFRPKPDVPTSGFVAPKRTFNMGRESRELRRVDNLVAFRTDREGQTSADSPHATDLRRTAELMQSALVRYDDLLHHIYDCALAPTQWPAALGAIAEAFDARSAVLWSFMHGVEQGGICFTHRLDQSVMQAWAAISPAEDPFVQAAIARHMLVDGAAYRELDLVSRDWLTQSRPYREVCALLDIGHVGIGIVFAGSDGRQLPVAISLYRSPRDLPFEDEAIDLLRRLLPHLSRSLGVMFHLRDQANQIAASRAALNHLAASVLLLDSKGFVQFANAAAEELLRRGDKVRRTTQHTRRQGTPSHLGRLAVATGSSEVRAAFTKVIAAAIRPYVDNGDDEHFAEALVLPDDHGKPALVMHAAPLGLTSSFAESGTSVRAIVFFHELNGHRAVAPQRLCQIFGMTPAEARAALQLLESGSMQDMADRLGVSLNTFKTQIQAAYAKTNTNRQAGLLRLILSLATA